MGWCCRRNDTHVLLRRCSLGKQKQRCTRCRQGCCNAHGPPGRRPSRPPRASGGSGPPAAPSTLQLEETLLAQDWAVYWWHVPRKLHFSAQPCRATHSEPAFPERRGSGDATVLEALLCWHAACAEQPLTPRELPPVRSGKGEPRLRCQTPQIRRRPPAAAPPSAPPFARWAWSPGQPCCLPSSAAAERRCRSQHKVLLRYAAGNVCVLLQAATTKLAPIEVFERVCQFGKQSWWQARCCNSKIDRCIVIHSAASGCLQCAVRSAGTEQLTAPAFLLRYFCATCASVRGRRSVV